MAKLLWVIGSYGCIFSGLWYLYDVSPDLVVGVILLYFGIDNLKQSKKYEYRRK